MDGNKIIGFDKNYTFIKLEPVVYPQLITSPQIKMGGGQGFYAQFAVVQENNFQDSFPRQILRVNIPD